MSTADREGVVRGGGAALQLLRTAAVLSLLSLLWQYLTAGQLFGRGGGPEGLHAGGAIVLHVVTGLTALAAVVHQRATRGPVWPSVLAVVVFALTFVQAATGGRDSLAVHVPGALVLAVGSVWLAAWSFTGARRA